MYSSLSFEDTISIERDLSYTLTIREFSIKGDVVGGALLFVSAVRFGSTFNRVKVVFHHTLPIRE